MSINSLANEAVIQSDEFKNKTPGGGGAADGTADEKAVYENRVTQSRNILFKYIPTESVTLYVAACSASAALVKLFPWLTPIKIYWIFAAFTPALVLLLYWGKSRAVQLQVSLYNPLKWPLWKMFAAFTAFLTWALAVPKNPYIGDDDTLAVAAGFLAIFVSTILHVLEPIFVRKTASGQ